MLYMPTPMLLSSPVGPDPSAAAYFAAMTVQPDAARKALIEAYIVGLKSDDVWSKLDCLWLIAAHDSQAARLNAANPGAQVLAPQNSPTFTPDRGYTCNGTSSYIRTGYTPGPLFTQNSAHASVWLNAVTSETASSTQFAVGYLGSSADSNPNTLSLSPRTPNGGAARVNDAAGGLGPAVTSKLGFTAGSRVSSAQKIIRRDASSVTQSGSSSALPGREMGLMRSDSAYDATGFDVYLMQGRIAMASAGAGLTDTEIGAFYSRTNTYLAAIGAN